MAVRAGAEGKWGQGLERLRLFGGMETDALEAICTAGTRVQRRRGEVLFRQGAVAGRLYVLLSGRVKLTQLTADGHLVLLRVVVPGEAFGGVAALGNRTYPVSAEAAEDCVLLGWGGAAMDRLLRSHAQLAMNLIDLLAERLHDMQSRYEELATQQVEQRLARTLLRLMHKAGRGVEGGMLVDVRLSRQELAEMTGMSLFTVSRILKRWQEAGIIQSKRQRILVCRPGELMGIAEELAG
jgi:CRP-like cAMP-binding protein